MPPGPCSCPQPSPPQVATFNFTGTPAKVLRMWLPYASPDTEMVVVLNLLGVNSRWGSCLGMKPLDRDVWQQQHAAYTCTCHVALLFLPSTHIL